MAGRKSSDPRQLSLDGYFAVPPAPEPQAGSFDFDRELRNSINLAIKECPQSRAKIAAAMTDLCFGDADAGEITKNMIDAWTAPSRSAWAFPAKYLPALVQATGAVWLLDQLAGKCGCRILVGEQALLAELGAVLLHEKHLRKRKARLEQAVPVEVLERLIEQARNQV